MSTREFTRLVFIIAIVALIVSQSFAQREMSIAAIQGDKNLSPVAEEKVQVTGIVTARIRTGFFIQSPDDKTDGNPATSEAVFVFTRTEPDAKAVVGSLVSVTGKVEEFRRNTEPSSLTITEIIFESVRVVSESNLLPKPITLSLADFKPNTIDQLERFEGMRVHVAELHVIAPTNGRVDVKTASAESNGTFYGVLKGIARPFREPGFEISDFFALDDKDQSKLRTDYPKMQIFDGNPERLRIESAFQARAVVIDASTGSNLRDVTGILHYSYRTNTLLIDPGYKAVLNSTIKPKPMPGTSEREFSVAGMNIENFFDDFDDPKYKEEIVSTEGFQKRLKKISLAVRDVLKMPDVIGVIEVESIDGLKILAKQINEDAIATGLPDPKYAAYLLEGNDGRGIDNGFLVKSSRVKVLEIKQLGKDDEYKNPGTKEDNFLNDRTPLVLRAAIDDAKTGKPFEFTAIVNHMKSYLGYNDPRQMANVRMKKRLQAEYLAKFVQERQKANPLEKIILLGDFNSYQFSDGIMDMIGTLKGSPAAKDSLMIASDDLVNPDLINLVDVINATERYSYAFDGNAQTLDHILVSETLKNHIKGFGFARLNADYPESFRNDPTRPERFSDHDPAVAYFSLDPIR
jgi:predicted extracellular nuclease